MNSGKRAIEAMKHFLDILKASYLVPETFFDLMSKEIKILEAEQKKNEKDNIVSFKDSLEKLNVKLHSLSSELGDDGLYVWNHMNDALEMSEALLKQQSSFKAVGWMGENKIVRSLGEGVWASDQKVYILEE